ncbi:MAG: hypothetical protein K6F53_08255 [Lachnospiraceae bacterium]|nr:hypothetical protein [Lachnospiraceae bacterium]
MNNASRVLLKNLLLATSRMNTYRYSTDRKKKKRALMNMIGAGVLYVMLISYSASFGFACGSMGIAAAIPAMCALLICILAFFRTIFRTNGYLFNFREYDMLMALPFEPKTVAACKFFYMYANSLPWYMSISAAMMAGYGFYEKPPVYIYPVWILLTAILPLVPMVGAAFVGFLFAKISIGFRAKKAVQTVLLFAFVIFCFSLRYIIEGIFKNDQLNETVETLANAAKQAGICYPPIAWFSDSITKSSISGMLLLVGISLVLFSVVFRLVGNSYRRINSAMQSHEASKKYRMTAQKVRSVRSAVAFKEMKRMLGSTTYMVNVGMGEVLAVLLGIVVLIFGFDRIIGTVTQGAPLTAAMLYPAIPLIVYFMIGMLPTTVCSPSLEGDNYWIVQSLPIEKKVLYQGKMLFNLYLSIPAMAIATVCFCISAKAPLLNTVLYLICGTVLCVFSTVWGCVCGLKHIRLDWENEVEVIKQGAAVLIYLFPNMIVTMALCVLAVILGMKMSQNLLTIVLIFIMTVLSGLSYLHLMKLIRKSS